MPRSAVPHALEMRRLKYGADVSEAEKDVVAKTLRDAGRLEEAMLLYEGRPDHPDLRDDLRRAVREGRSFPLFLLRRMGAPVDDDAIRDCAKAAEGAGRWLDAHRCHTALGDADGLARIAPHLPGFSVAVPANKV